MINMISDSAESIIAQALKLSAADRAEIADKLLFSLNPPDKAIDELWAKETEARIDAYERGEIKTRSIEEVFRKYDKK
jgi:putative addiction module component (TIGR02574 family)